jgi:DNA-binding response OmpR family regulator
MRLLLVEDDPTLGVELQNTLNKSGYATDLAVDGEQALAIGQIEPYDLVVLDLGLPKCSGLEVLNEWRKQGHAVPVIILTARDSWEEKVQGFKVGADDYVTKPFQTEELLVRINAVLRRVSGQNTGELVYQDIKLNELTQTVLIKNDSYELTGTEFKLLRYFMLHPNKVISKSELVEHVYQYDSDKDSNVMEVYVNRLRQKISA